MRILILSFFVALVFSEKTHSQYYNYYPLPYQNGNAYVVPVVVENNPNAYQLPSAFQVPDMSRISYEAGNQNAQADKNWREFTSQAGAWARIINSQKEMELRERQIALMERQARLQEEAYKEQMKQIEQQNRLQQMRIENLQKNNYENNLQGSNIRPDNPDLLDGANPDLKKYYNEINMLIGAIEREIETYYEKGEYEAIKRIKIGEHAASIFPTSDQPEIIKFINQKIEALKKDALSTTR